MGEALFSGLAACNVREQCIEALMSEAETAAWKNALVKIPG
jgi:hypothetical protein